MNTKKTGSSPWFYFYLLLVIAGALAIIYLPNWHGAEKPSTSQCDGMDAKRCYEQVIIPQKAQVAELFYAKSIASGTDSLKLTKVVTTKTVCPAKQMADGVWDKTWDCYELTDYGNGTIEARFLYSYGCDGKYCEHHGVYVGDAMKEEIIEAATRPTK